MGRTRRSYVLTLAGEYFLTLFPFSQRTVIERWLHYADCLADAERRDERRLYSYPRPITGAVFGSEADLHIRRL